MNELMIFIGIIVVIFIATLLLGIKRHGIIPTILVSSGVGIIALYILSYFRMLNFDIVSLLISAALGLPGVVGLLFINLI